MSRVNIAKFKDGKVLFLFTMQNKIGHAKDTVKEKKEKEGNIHKETLAIVRVKVTQWKNKTKKNPVSVTLR